MKSFLGIPFAKAPVGALRWKAPQPAEASEKVFEARYYGPSAPQPINEHSALRDHQQKEDCLYLNVWTAEEKNETEKKPVLVYVHGGDFSYGGAADPMNSGENFVEAHPDTVVVSFNYRLGVLGFIDFSDIPGGEEYPNAAYLGILDQIAAFRWVKENIAAFGGDPDRITAIGDSVGSASISLLAVCKEAKGLFRKAILISGTPELANENRDLSRKAAKWLAEDCQASSMEELVKIPEDILQEKIAGYHLSGLGPVYDGVFFPKNIFQAYTEGKAADIQFMMGLASDELGVYNSMFNADVVQSMIPGLFDDLLKKLTDVQAKEIKTILDEKEKELGKFKMQEWFVDNWYHLIAALYMARCLKTGGKAPYVFYWNSQIGIEKLGTGTPIIVSTMLGNHEAAEAFGTVVHTDNESILQELLMKFLQDQDVKLYNNELRGVSAIEWMPYPNVMEITNQVWTCREQFLDEGMEDINRLLTVLTK